MPSEPVLERRLAPEEPDPHRRVFRRWHASRLGLVGDRGARDGVPYRRILCPIDFDDIAAKALKVAAQIAHGNDAMVIILHILPFIMPPTYPPIRVYTIDEQQEAARTRLRELAQRHLKGIRHELSTHVGNAAATITSRTAIWRRRCSDGDTRQAGLVARLFRKRR